MKNDDKRRLGFLAKTVGEAIDRLEKGIKKHYKGDAKPHPKVSETVPKLKDLRKEIGRFRSLMKGEKLVVGIWGRINRGKSSFLNVLLGTDILPRDDSQGTTRFCTELRHKNSKGSSPYKITVWDGKRLLDSDKYSLERGKSETGTDIPG